VRIKMQCPDCGKWFTLELALKGSHAVKNEAESPDRSRAEPSHAESDAPRAPQHTGSPRMKSDHANAWRVGVVPIIVVAALVLAWLLWVGPSLERSRTGVVSSTSAAQAETEVPDDEAPPVDAGPDALDASSRDAAGEVPSDAVASEGATVDEPPSEAAAVPADERTPSSYAMEITLVASERCWVRVVTDGGVVSDMTMDAGESRTWKADESAELSVGSGQDIEIYLNGERLGPAGRGPRVVEGLVITAEGLAR
jgi:hypothetical protein